MVLLNNLFKLSLGAALLIPAFGSANAAEELVGTYQFDISPATGMMQFSGSASIEVNIKTDGEDYWMEEAGTPQYFYEGSSIKITVSDNNMGFKQYYTGLADNVWFYPGDSSGMPQNSITVKFDKETGFDMTAGSQSIMNKTLIWIDSKSSTNFDPKGDIYKGFKITGGGQKVEAGGPQTYGPFDWTIQPIDMNGYVQGGTQNIQVKVTLQPSEDGNTQAGLIEEFGGTSYFFSSVPFTYNVGTATAEFAQTYTGKQEDGEYIWSAICLYTTGARMIELQDQYTMDFSTEDGFTLKSGHGLCWISGETDGSEADSGLTPTMNYFSGFLFNEGGRVGNGAVVDKNFPAYTELQGTHQFTGTLTWEQGYESLATTLPQKITGFNIAESFEFTLASTNPALSKFVGNGRENAMNYDQNTGLLEFPNNPSLGGYTDFNNNYAYMEYRLADAEGNYNTAYGTPSSFFIQATENGKIYIPDFTIIQTQPSYAIVARYTNVKVDGYPEPSLAISNPVVVVDGRNVQITVDVNAKDLEMVTEWDALLVPDDSQAENIEIEKVFITEDNNFTIELDDVDFGEYNYTLTLTGFYNDAKMMESNGINVDFLVASLVISDAQGEQVAGTYNVNVSFDVNAQGVPANATYTVTLSDEENEDINIDVTVADGVCNFTLEDLEAGEYTYNVVLTAYNEDEVILASEPIELSFEVEVVLNPYIEVSNINYTISDEEDAIIFTFDAEINDIAEDAEFTVTLTEENGGEIVVAAEKTQDGWTAVVTGLENGDYTFSFVMRAFENDEEVAASEAQEISVNYIANGINGIAADENARYFTIQGVEVKNPVKGVYIRVVGDTATKVVIR